MVLAALFVVGAMAAAIGLLEAGVIGRNLWDVALFMLALSIVALVLFNPLWINPRGRVTKEERLRRLEAEGLLVSSNFRARRAFGVRESGDEGSHYFLELADGRVLYLSGEYLYDYEPIDEDSEFDQPRSFPCTDFTVHRHKTEGHVVGLVCRGTVLEPELMAPPFSERARRSIGALEDGQVLADRPYDRLKELMLADPAEPDSASDRGGM